jgi:hypothetical protein
MSTMAYANAEKVLPESLVRKLQKACQGKGTMLYVPPVTQDLEPSYHLEMVHRFTQRGWSAAQIAQRLKISPRQVFRLRKQLREHPELFDEPTPAYKPVPVRERRVTRRARQADEHGPDVRDTDDVRRPATKDPNVLEVTSVPFAIAKNF